MITEYDKKWVPSSKSKDYLQDTKHITIDFNVNEEKELPSQAQYLASPNPNTLRKMDPSLMHATYNSDRSDLEMTD